MRKIYNFDNVDCPHCADLMKKAILQIDGVKDCVLNFLAKKMVLEYDLKDKSRIISEIEKVCKEIVPEFEIEF